MASKEGKNVMSPEHAMKREMAYRHRIELLQLINGSSGPGKLPAAPSQTSLPASGPTPGTELAQSRKMRPKLREHTPANPGPWPGPKTKPSPNPLPRPPRGPSSLQRPGLSSSKANPRTKSVIVGPRPRIPQSPTGSLPQPKPSAIGPSTGPRPSLQTTLSVSQRLGPTLGSTHKRKEPPTQQLLPYDHDGKMSKTVCEVCKVHCSSPANLQMHLMGQKHQAAVNKGKRVRSSKDDPSLYCSLCDIWCMNEFSLKQHLSGKNHILKLHSAKTKK